MEIKKINLIICVCAERKLIDEEKLKIIINSAENKGYKINLISDLCFFSVKENDELKKLFLDDVKTIIAACYPRAINTLLKNIISKEKYSVLNLRTDDIETILNLLELEIINKNNKIELPEYKEKWSPWFPSIDEERCINCGKCADFCMFGVYSIINKKVVVVNPSNCKNNCPACARMCPETAIVFCKYPDEPINGGIENKDKNVSIDVKELYKGDIYKKLAARRNRNRNKLLKNE
jgi:heterodisulfide reductase subunit A-like polyferredoxin